MKAYTLDNIVRSALAEKQYPLHWYLQYLTYGVDSLRQLNMDVMQNVKSVRLPVNSYFAATLPNDFVDYIRVGNEQGEFISSMGEKRDVYNRLNNFDAQGNKISYGDTNVNVTPTNWDGLWYTNFINDKGEHLGRMFNNTPAFNNSFVILRERSEIQFDKTITDTSITMDYITDGLSTDASNTVHPYAVDAIKAYIFWKAKEHGRQFNISEKQWVKEEFYNQLRILRARMNSIDVIDIRRSLARGYGPTIKN